MPNSSLPKSPPEPWAGFLQDLEALLSEQVQLHCLGGFVMHALYGLPRITSDVDYIDLRPHDQINHLQEMAGPDSKLARKYKVYLQYVAVATCPENYADRLIEMYPGHFRNLRIFALDPYDLALSKLERNNPKDREDVKFLAKQIPLKFQVLENRYRQELRPHLANQERHDLTLELWRDAFFNSNPV